MELLRNTTSEQYFCFGLQCLKILRSGEGVHRIAYVGACRIRHRLSAITASDNNQAIKRRMLYIGNPEAESNEVFLN